MMDKTVNAIMTAFIGVILIASAFIPTAIDQIQYLTSTFAGTESESVVSGYAGLLVIVVTITILGIVIGVLKTYNLTSIGGEGKREE